jgi:pimeloyl-ACP methyl ester carboxylesterase
MSVRFFRFWWLLTAAAAAVSARAEDASGGSGPVSPLSTSFTVRAPEAEPGSVGPGRKPATWDRARDFESKFAGHVMVITRIGDGPRGVVLFAPPDSGRAKEMLRPSASIFRSAIGRGASLFTLEYPELFMRRLVGRLLTRSLEGDETARLDAKGMAAAVVAQIRETTGIKDLLLVGNSMGAGLILADYDELSRDERNSFLLVSPMDLFLPDKPPDGPPVRTVMMANEDSDPFLQNEEWQRWVAAHKDGPAMEALEAARDTSDPLSLPFTHGHLTVGEHFDPVMLARLLRYGLGEGGLDELRAPHRLPSFTHEGRRVVLEINGATREKVVMFDPEAPSQRLHYRSLPTSAVRPWDATMVAWDFVEPDDRGAYVPGVAPEIVRNLRRLDAGPIVLYGIGEGANLLLHDYDELSAMPGVSLILLCPREKLMPRRPWPELDRAVTVLVANEQTDPGVRSEEFRFWLVANKHSFSDVLNHWFAQWHTVSRLPGLPPLHPLAERPKAPEMFQDVSYHIRDFHLHKVSDFALGYESIYERLPRHLRPFPVKRPTDSD